MTCDACSRGDHHNCGLQTWCECDCEGPDGFYLDHPLDTSTGFDDPENPPRKDGRDDAD